MTRAIEPPPAPTVRTSTIGTWIGMAYSSSISFEIAGGAVADQGDVGRGAAHVVGDEVGDAGAAGGVGGGHDAGGGAGHHRLRGLAGDVRRGDHAAVAGDDEEVAGVAAGGELGLEAGEVALEERAGPRR